MHMQCKHPIIARDMKIHSSWREKSRSGPLTDVTHATQHTVRYAMLKLVAPGPERVHPFMSDVNDVRVSFLFFF